MDFDEILRQWDQRSRTKHDRTREQIERWIDTHPPGIHGRDEEEESPLSAPGERLRDMPPQRTIDLHGLRVREAKSRTVSFIDQAVSEHLSKVLIIHGKGKHSKPGETVSGGLRQAVYEVLRAHPFVGEIGVPHRRLGGTGAVWAVLREKPKKRRDAVG